MTAVVLESVRRHWSYEIVGTGAGGVWCILCSPLLSAVSAKQGVLSQREETVRLQGHTGKVKGQRGAWRTQHPTPTLSLQQLDYKHTNEYEDLARM